MNNTELHKDKVVKLNMLMPGRTKERTAPASVAIRDARDTYRMLTARTANRPITV